MTAPQIRHQIHKITPSWLQGAKGGPFMHTIGLGLDAMLEWAVSGITARMPDFAGVDALEVLGRDRRMVRGFDESNAEFAERLKKWRHWWQRAGHAYALMEQVAGYLAGHNVTIRVVTNSGVWYQRDPDADVVFDASAATRIGGAYVLPAWLTLTRASAEASAQQSASTWVSGYPADAARAYSQDGSAFGLLLEPALTNLADEQDLSAWAGTAIVRSTVGPDGTSGSFELEDDDGGTPEYSTYTIGALGADTYTLSLAHRVVSVDADGALARVFDSPTPYAPISLSSAAADWSHGSATETTGALTNAVLQLFPATGAATVGVFRAWGIQFEARAYPTSFQGADNATFSRSADILRAEPAAVMPGGYFDLTIKYRPHYAHDETTANHSIFVVDGLNYAYYSTSQQKFALVLDGATVVWSSAVTFSRHQELTLAIKHTAAGRELTVSGATTGDGTATDTAVAALALPSDCYILGTAGGSQEGSDLTYFDANNADYGRFSWSKAGGWNWDGLTAEWSRFWLIIYSPDSLWTQPTYELGNVLLWGGDVNDPTLTIGSTATREQAETVRGIVQTWKPKHAQCETIIVSFDASAFDPNGTPEPDGTWGPAWSSGTAPRAVNRIPEATYWAGVD